MIFKRKFGYLYAFILFIALLLLSSCMQTSTNLRLDKSTPLTLEPGTAFDICGELSKPVYEGREIGTSGNELAMEYIEKYFGEIGLKTAPNASSFRQNFKALKAFRTAVPVLTVKDSKGNTVRTYKFRKDFSEIISSFGIGGTYDGPLSIFNGMDSAKGHKALLLDRNLAYYSYLEQFHSLGVQLVIQDLPSAYVDKRFVSMNDRKVDEIAKGFIRIGVTTAVFNDLSMLTLSGCTVSVSVDLKFDWVDTANVIGYLPASVETDDTVVVSAHLDHIGIDSDGTLYPGAYDNASGVSVMMSLAKVVGAHRDSLTKNVLFVAFNAEEEGLRGSEYYLKHPLVSLKNSVFVNLDVVGINKKVPLMVISTQADPAHTNTKGFPGNELAVDLKALAQRLGFDVTVMQSLGKGYSTDAASFSDYGYQAVSVVQDDEEFIHSPLDTISVISKEMLDIPGETVLDYIEVVAMQ